jgi:hypothetical protein
LFIDRHLFGGKFEKMASSRGAATEPAAPAEPLIVTVGVVLNISNAAESIELSSTFKM